MKRIAFVAHLSEVSGSGVALLETVTALAEDFDAHLILPSDGPLAGRVVQRGITPVIIENPEISLSEAGTRQKVSLAGNRMRFVWQLRQFFRRQKIDLVYVNTSASIFPAVAAKLAGLPIVWHIHETLEANDRRTAWKKRIIRRWANGLVYASQSGMRHLPPPAGTPSLIARNYIRIKELAPIGKARLTNVDSLIPQQSTILMNGTIRRKGADILLQAAQLLRKTAPALDFQIVIAGVPPDDIAFGNLLTELQDSPELAGRIRFAGMQESLIPLLKDATIFVSPARNEALPIAIVEAMAAGVPIITADIGDCGALLNNGQCGWVVPPEDPRAIADAIFEATSERTLLQSKAEAAYAKVNDVYGAEDFWNPLKTFINSID